jgi:ornithine cyclodeaminase/alanine dehydrogenase-like protein (mu-crystallin family)
MSDDGQPTLRYLSAADVTASMPALAERLALAERTMTLLAQGAELPSKISIHPRPEGSFVHAMPANARGARDDGIEDLVGIKWIAGFGTNNARGIPALHGVIVLNDPRTGVPAAIIDAGPVTALRTAAVSGVAIGRFVPDVGARAPRAGLIGAGVQGRSHLAVLGHLLPGVDVALFDRHPERVESLAELARSTPGIAAVRSAANARDAVAGADVVVTCAAFTSPDRRQVMTNDWLAPDALVVPVDYATYVAAEVARDAALFLVDQREQFLANRDDGAFDGYPDPTATIGEAILAGTRRPAGGRVVVTHLGVGLADLVFADAIVRRARELGLGLNLPR